MAIPTQNKAETINAWMANQFGFSTPGTPLYNQIKNGLEALPIFGAAQQEQAAPIVGSEADNDE